MTKRIDRRGFVASSLATAAATTLGVMVSASPALADAAERPDADASQPTDAFPFAEMGVA